jgi:hypothetical protein
VLNDALCLRSVDELGLMNIPVQSPLSWQKTIDGVHLDVRGLCLPSDDTDTMCNAAKQLVPYFSSLVLSFWERDIASTVYPFLSLAELYTFTFFDFIRMRETHEDLASFTSQLNWRGTTRFAELTGQVPGSSGINFDQRMFNYTASDSAEVTFFLLILIYNSS